MALTPPQQGRRVSGNRVSAPASGPGALLTSSGTGSAEPQARRPKQSLCCFLAVPLVPAGTSVFACDRFAGLGFRSSRQCASLSLLGGRCLHHSNYTPDRVLWGTPSTLARFICVYLAAACCPGIRAGACAPPSLAVSPRPLTPTPCVLRQVLPTSTPSSTGPQDFRCTRVRAQLDSVCV